MATKKRSTNKPAIKAKKITPKPLPPMKEGVCGVDGYCCQGKSPEECCGGKGCGCGTVMGCHIAGMLTKRSTWGTAIIAAVILWLTDWLWHGVILFPRYDETGYLWRATASMESLWYWCIIYHLLYGLVFAILFKFIGGGGLVKSAKNGALIASPLAINSIMAYFSQPIPSDIVQMWAVGALLQGAIVGLALGLLAKRCGGCCK